MPGTFEDMAFTKEFAEWCVTSFGEIVMLESIKMLLNFAYNEFNVPAKEILMLTGFMEPNPNLHFQTPGAPTA